MFLLNLQSLKTGCLHVLHAVLALSLHTGPRPLQLPVQVRTGTWQLLLPAAPVRDSLLTFPSLWLQLLYHQQIAAGLRACTEKVFTPQSSASSKLRSAT